VTDRRLRRDERAIEGLPIRLVIAVVVGIAALSVMMSTISGLGSLGVDEVDVEPEPDVIEQGSTDLSVAVVDHEGKPVANATVIARSGTARLDELTTARTDYDGTATLSIEPSLRPNQREGTVELDVKPPSGSYADRRSNTPILVVRR
jgi:hypothetical protein